MGGKAMVSSDNPVAIIERIKSQFSSAYLNLISLIEAAILGLLIFRFAEELILAKHGTLDTVIIWIQMLTAFLIIVVVWGEYVIGAMVFKWIPGVADPFIPFLTGIAQVSGVYYSGSTVSPQWLFSLAAICGFSWWAFVNMYQKSESDEDNKLVLKALGRWRKANYVIMGTLTGIISVTGIIVSLYSSEWLDITISGLTMVAMIAYLFKCHYYWKNIRQFCLDRRSAKNDFGRNETAPIPPSPEPTKS